MITRSILIILLSFIYIGNIYVISLTNANTPLERVLFAQERFNADPNIETAKDFISDIAKLYTKRMTQDIVILETIIKTLFWAMVVINLQTFPFPPQQPKQNGKVLICFIIYL